MSVATLLFADGPRKGLTLEWRDLPPYFDFAIMETPVMSFKETDIGKMKPPETLRYSRVGVTPDQQTGVYRVEEPKHAR